MTPPFKGYSASKTSLIMLPENYFKGSCLLFTIPNSQAIKKSGTSFYSVSDWNKQYLFFIKWN